MAKKKKFIEKDEKKGLKIDIEKGFSKLNEACSALLKLREIPGEILRDYAEALERLYIFLKESLELYEVLEEKNKTARRAVELSHGILKGAVQEKALLDGNEKGVVLARERSEYMDELIRDMGKLMGEIAGFAIKKEESKAKSDISVLSRFEKIRLENRFGKS